MNTVVWLFQFADDWWWPSKNIESGYQRRKMTFMLIINPYGNSLSHTLSELYKKRKSLSKSTLPFLCPFLPDVFRLHFHIQQLSLNWNKRLKEQTFQNTISSPSAVSCPPRLWNQRSWFHTHQYIFLWSSGTSFHSSSAGSLFINVFITRFDFFTFKALHNPCSLTTSQDFPILTLLHGNNLKRIINETCGKSQQRKVPKISNIRDGHHWRQRVGVIKSKWSVGA